MSIPELEQHASNGTGEPEVIDQPTYDKAAWLGGATDRAEDEVFVSEEQGWVKVRGLSAGQQATIQDQCLVLKGDTMKLDTQQMDVMWFTAGVIEPKFTHDEANVISHNFGKGFTLVVSVIKEISKATEEDVQKARRRFRPRR